MLEPVSYLVVELSYIAYPLFYLWRVRPDLLGTLACVCAAGLHARRLYLQGKGPGPWTREVLFAGLLGACLYAAQTRPLLAGLATGAVLALSHWMRQRELGVPVRYMAWWDPLIFVGSTWITFHRPFGVFESPFLGDAVYHLLEAAVLTS